MSKVFNATLATSVVVGSGILAVPTQAQAETISFSDVKIDSNFYNSIIELAKSEIMVGNPDGTFKPEKVVTRGEVAKIIANALKLTTDNVKNPGFTDVPQSHIFYKEIAALNAEGIIFGIGNNKYNPEAPVTRAQLATILSKAFSLSKANFKELPFEDVQSENVHADDIKRVLDNKVTNGTSKVTFSPEQSVTREQVALLTYNAMNAKSTTLELNIMHSNDTHSKVDLAPKRAQAVKDIRALRPNALLLDAGDANTGTLYYNEFKGQADLAFLNYMGYDAMTFGNHEFDQGDSDEGHQALVDFIKGAKFPLVSSNIDFSKDDKFTGLFTDLISSEPENGKIYNGIIKEVNGEKIGIFGLTTQDTEGISSPGEITFENYKEEAEKAVKAFEDKGVDKIVLLSHLGYDDNPGGEDDLSLAKAVNGIDIIVGGHSHTKLEQPDVVTTDENGVAKDPTIIVQAANNSDYLGTLDIVFDKNGVVVDFKGKLISISGYTEDPEAVKLLKPYKDQVELISADEIGVTSPIVLELPRTNGDDTKPSVRKNETILGNLITDGMLVKANKYTDKKVIMALQNGGGIRKSINEGPITVGEVIEVLPYGNTLALMDITGAELKEAFELSVSKYPVENGGFLHVAGGKIEFDSSKPAGNRIVSISYKDENGKYLEIEADKTYTVATNAFTAKGGDSYDVFEKIYVDGRVTDLGLSDWENLREHLQSLKELPTETEGRIVDISAN
ncbi:2', 3'-cyclic nucleotide 2'-phosphodiesterase [Ureibacillus manganicus DSM 26584]|uniref:2', 3'-cyclic nucleotide 2'-phosphodiesterase n=2 Tax=Ureibacillus TaxID=160795 RepID=A0A0A3I293_9BACL|nr:2', 3'-cyclic nucleotide 2'-phosphodiesterase [Ureibacillus manganicus DSM 26584]